MKSYRYHICGSAADGQTWEAHGKLRCEFHVAFDAAMRDTFQQLTDGKAKYGHPGKGCDGPYDIHSVNIWQTGVKKNDVS